jgi:hypothetical protein
LVALTRASLKSVVNASHVSPLVPRSSTTHGEYARVGKATTTNSDDTAPSSTNPNRIAQPVSGTGRALIDILLKKGDQVVQKSRAAQ